MQNQDTREDEAEAAISETQFYLTSNAAGGMYGCANCCLVEIEKLKSMKFFNKAS